MAGGIIEQIPNRADANIFAMYTDYESDANGEYAFLIGAKVTSLGSIQKECILSKFQTLVMRSSLQKKARQEVVPETWQKLWSKPASEMGGERAFFADFKAMTNAPPTRRMRWWRSGWE